MNQQFQEQGGAATMDPSPLLRWLTSMILRRICSIERLHRRRARFERRRRKAGRKHVVEYFHQVEDGYSHLAAQLLRPLTRRYDIELVCHLVRGPRCDNVPEPDLLLQLSRYDAFQVAPAYGLTFPEHPASPDPELLGLATAILAARSSESFIDCASAVGDALWSGEKGRLEEMAARLGICGDAEVAARLDAGTARRAQLQHYSGAMFFYGGEWYWGVDRLYHLERRLAELDADRQPGQPMIAPRPPLNAGELKDNGSMTLEVFPSLRSPYTAIAFDLAVKLAAETEVRLVVRPVLPMVMRGVPATREKGLYIFSDAAREAREAGVRFGTFYDPIGNPVRRCYAMYPWASEQGRGNELISSFLDAAFASGINTNTDRGLRRVVEAAGLDWAEAQKHLDDQGWEDLFEGNRQAMYEAGLWGVPSFRLLDDNGEQLLALWGQDRLWLIAREIQRRLTER